MAQSHYRNLLCLLAIFFTVVGLQIFTPSPLFSQDTTVPNVNTTELAEEIESPLISTSLTEVIETAESEEAAKPKGFAGRLNDFLNSSLGKVNTGVFYVLFVPINGEERDSNKAFPLIVAVLVFGGVFFTLWFKFISIRGFRHSIDVVRGRYDNPDDEGEITHFRALTSALSATVGLGNIAGVAVAIQVGGPGAVLWMTVAGFFGMAMKFTECTLGQMYRRTNPDGTISGGPMYYLHLGLKDTRLALVGKILSVIIAFMVMAAALGGGNMFQANQTFEAIRYVFNVDEDLSWVFGIVMAILVGVVVVGGIKRIGAATSKIVPVMAAIYILGALLLVGLNIGKLPHAIATIFEGAFAPAAAYGGLVGVLVQGFRRAAFSNEAGIGSASIAHSAAKTKEPVREGMVALLEPFIDTIIICNMTALVIVISGVYANPELTQGAINAGVALTKEAFSTTLPWFPSILVLCVALFAYSTMISWCYYGERGWIYLLDHLGEGVGLKTLIVFRLVFVVFVFIGTVVNIGAVVDFADAALLSMAFPNIIGAVILAPMLTRKVNDYWRRYKSGEMKPYW